VAVQTLAWTVPRRPGQFWTGVRAAGAVFLALALALRTCKAGTIPVGDDDVVVARHHSTDGFAWYAACATVVATGRVDCPWNGAGNFSGKAARRRTPTRLPLGGLGVVLADSLPALRLLAFGGWALAWRGSSSPASCYYGRTRKMLQSAVTALHGS